MTVRYYWPFYHSSPTVVKDKQIFSGGVKDLVQLGRQSPGEILPLGAKQAESPYYPALRKRRNDQRK